MIYNKIRYYDILLSNRLCQYVWTTWLIVKHVHDVIKVKEMDVKFCNACWFTDCYITVCVFDSLQLGMLKYVWYYLRIVSEKVSLSYLFTYKISIFHFFLNSVSITNPDTNVITVLEKHFQIKF